MLAFRGALRVNTLMQSPGTSLFDLIESAHPESRILRKLCELITMDAQLFRLVEPVSPADHVIGPHGAPVTVVEYGDFECPICKQAAGAVKLLLARFEQRIRFVFRHFPWRESTARIACRGDRRMRWRPGEDLADA